MRLPASKLRLIYTDSGILDCCLNLWSVVQLFVKAFAGWGDLLHKQTRNFLGVYRQRPWQHFLPVENNRQQWPVNASAPSCANPRLQGRLGYSTLIHQSEQGVILLDQ